LGAHLRRRGQASMRAAAVLCDMQITINAMIAGGVAEETSDTHELIRGHLQFCVGAVVSSCGHQICPPARCRQHRAMMPGSGPGDRPAPLAALRCVGGLRDSRQAKAGAPRLATAGGQFDRRGDRWGDLQLKTFVKSYLRVRVKIKRHE
jgi:hypothetical protein